MGLLTIILGISFTVGLSFLIFIQADPILIILWLIPGPISIYALYFFTRILLAIINKKPLTALYNNTLINRAIRTNSTSIFDIISLKLVPSYNRYFGPEFKLRVKTRKSQFDIIPMYGQGDTKKFILDLEKQLSL